jgi:phosphotransferase system  glucose/maltose/N-acetylglucosamine-specific IIC component
MSEDTTDIVASRETIPVPAKRNWKVLKIPVALVSCTINSVRRLPDLKEPVFDPYYLPERSGAIAAVLYNWSYHYRKLEYAVDPFGKGFRAWLRLFFALGFFICVPVAAILGLCWGAVIVLSRLGGVAGEALALTGRVALLLLGVIGVALLGYLTYLVVMILMGKPIKLPIPKILNGEEDSQKEDKSKVEL